MRRLILLSFLLLIVIIIVIISSIFIIIIVTVSTFMWITVLQWSFIGKYLNAYCVKSIQI